MAYIMVLCSNETKRYPIPQIGDVFVVSNLTEIKDIHLGDLIYVKLQPLAVEDGECMITVSKDQN